MIARYAQVTQCWFAGLTAMPYQKGKRGLTSAGVLWQSHGREEHMSVLAAVLSCWLTVKFHTSQSRGAEGVVGGLEA